MLLCRIQIGLRRKLISAAFISLSALTLSISIIRLALAILPDKVTDVVWVIFWTLIEAGIAIIIVSVTAFRSLFCQDGTATDGSHKPAVAFSTDQETASQTPSRLSCFLKMSRKSHSCEELPRTVTIISRPRPLSRHDRYDRLDSAVPPLDPEITKPARASIASRLSSSATPHAITTDIPHPHPLSSAPTHAPASVHEVLRRMEDDRDNECSTVEQPPRSMSASAISDPPPAPDDPFAFLHDAPPVPRHLSVGGASPRAATDPMAPATFDESQLVPAPDWRASGSSAGRTAKTAALLSREPSRSTGEHPLDRSRRESFEGRAVEWVRMARFMPSRERFEPKRELFDAGAKREGCPA